MFIFYFIMFTLHSEEEPSGKYRLRKLYNSMYVLFGKQY